MPLVGQVADHHGDGLGALNLTGARSAARTATPPPQGWVLRLACRFLEGVSQVDPHVCRRHERFGEFGTALSDQQVGNGVQAGEQFGRNLLRAGRSPDLAGNMGGGVEGDDGLVAEAERAVELGA